MRSLHFLVLALSCLPLPATMGQGFEFPVQLIGFPVIIIAVRIANFIKKLSYALSPNTYRSRPRRGLPAIDPGEVEKKLVLEMGEKVCIYERTCVQYAMDALAPETDPHVDWDQIFKKFASSPKDKGEFFLLSVFLGDIVGSPELCRGLAKRGRSCGREPWAVPEQQLLQLQPTPPSLHDSSLSYSSPPGRLYSAMHSSALPFFSTSPQYLSPPR